MSGPGCALSLGPLHTAVQSTCIPVCFPVFSECCMVLVVVFVLWVLCSGVVLWHFADPPEGESVVLPFLPIWLLCAGGKLKVWNVH